MEPTLIRFIALLFLAALYLPVIFFAIQRRNEGQGAATWLIVVYALFAMVLNVTEAAWTNGGTPFLIQELQTYIAFTLTALLIIALQIFVKRETWWLWVGFWVFWALGIALILTNALDLPETIWTNGNLVLYRSRLGPAWAILGWLIVVMSFILSLANANRESRQPLFRNRLNYWWLVVFFTLLGDIILFSGVVLIGQPLRLAAVITAAYVVGTHYVPDLKNI
ncbi:MAG TPA: hypothetical protein PKI78_09715, partial [Anaerolineales bacterium]|nr:hypothetical protein [Anaerolineales bacterium]